MMLPALRTISIAHGVPTNDLKTSNVIYISIYQLVDCMWLYASPVTMTSARIGNAKFCVNGLNSEILTHFR